MKQHFSTLLLSFLFLSASAQIKLPRLIRDSMVLQRDTRLKLWGWASAGEKVAVSFQRKTYRTTTGRDGKWTLFLPPQKTGGPYALQVKGKNEITLNGVLVGDVWVCAGQSNMVHQMSLHSERYAKRLHLPTTHLSGISGYQP
jgi:sialate O-acetylesterase